MEWDVARCCLLLRGMRMVRSWAASGGVVFLAMSVSRVRPAYVDGLCSRDSDRIHVVVCAETEMENERERERERETSYVGFGL